MTVTAGGGRRRHFSPVGVIFAAPDPSRVTDCTYCGSAVAAHDPVYVDEVVDGERTTTGRFCNYGCLAAHVEAAGLATGASCQWEPSA